MSIILTVIVISGISIGTFGLKADVDSRNDFTSSIVTSLRTSKDRESTETVPDLVTRRKNRPENEDGYTDEIVDKLLYVLFCKMRNYREYDIEFD